MIKLLKSLSQVHSPSGEEVNMKQFILNFVETNSKKWKVYYEDINVIFTVDKSTNKILSADYKD